MPQVTRIDYTDVIPMTVQNIMLEHMEACRLSRDARNAALIGIAREMEQYGYCVKGKEE
jgi:hypothetical protein